METVAYQPPTQAELEADALKFLKGSAPKEFKKMSKEQVREYCQTKAKEAADYARRLIETGMYEGQAWIQAQRIVILERDSD